MVFVLFKLKWRRPFSWTTETYENPLCLSNRKFRCNCFLEKQTAQVLWRQLLDLLKFNINFVFRSINNMTSAVLWIISNMFWFISYCVKKLLKFKSSVTVFKILVGSKFFLRNAYFPTICLSLRNSIYHKSFCSNQYNRHWNGYSSSSSNNRYYGCANSFIRLTCNNKTIIN